MLVVIISSSQFTVQRIQITTKPPGLVWIYQESRLRNNQQRWWWWLWLWVVEAA